MDSSLTEVRDHQNIIYIMVLVNFHEYFIKIVIRVTELQYHVFSDVTYFYPMLGIYYSAEQL